MAEKIVSADEARALLDGTTSGPWTYDPPNEQCPAWITQAHDPTEDVALIEDVLDVDGRLMASAPDLARSVEALHASESAAVARASRLALDLHAAQSEGAEARRDVRLRDETIEELRRTVREMSRACETLRERCERAENTHDAAAQAFDDLVARVWRAATGETHEGPASVDALVAAVVRMRNAIESVTGQLCDMTARHDVLRAIIAGRTTPPTDEEIEAHTASGGWWMVTEYDDEGREWAPVIDCDVANLCVLARRRLWHGRSRRWVAISRGQPCPWPVVGGAR